MRTRFLKSGHLPTLVAALLYFDVSFMVWVLLGPLAPFLREEFALTATEQGLVVAVPLLGGSLFRPVLGILVLFALMAKDSPHRRERLSRREYAAVLKEPDTLWFSFLYSLTFGGFVGFTSFLTTFFHEQYQVSKVAAGDFTTMVVVAGSLLRPVGGWLSDRIGGYRLLLVVLAAMAGCLMAAATLPSLPVVVAVLFVGVGLLGMGNGAVFQLVPQRFADSRAVMASIGPMISDELRRHGLAADFEPSHPKCGLLVREAAERSEDLLRAKRSHGSDR